MASKLVTMTKMNLWENQDLPVWDKLRQRGLSDQTIENAVLGWISRDRWDIRAKCGLPTELNENNRPKKLWIPEGLLIPIYNADQKIVRLWCRRFIKEGPKYYCFPGSSMKIFTLGTAGRPIVIVESDLDAWLINQQAGDIVTAASLGSSGKKPDSEFCAYLITAPKILVALDADPAGKKAARWWTDNFPNACYWPVPWSKDPGDAFGTASGVIKMWIQTGLKTGG
jgi:hypothetical protein